MPRGGGVVGPLARARHRIIIERSGPPALSISGLRWRSTRLPRQGAWFADSHEEVVDQDFGYHSQHWLAGDRQQQRGRDFGHPDHEDHRRRGR